MYILRKNCIFIKMFFNCFFILFVGGKVILLFCFFLWLLFLFVYEGILVICIFFWLLMFVWLIFCFVGVLFVFKFFVFWIIFLLLLLVLCLVICLLVYCFFGFELDLFVFNVFLLFFGCIIFFFLFICCDLMFFLYDGLVLLGLCVLLEECGFLFCGEFIWLGIVILLVLGDFFMILVLFFLMFGLFFLLFLESDFLFIFR